MTSFCYFQVFPAIYRIFNSSSGIKQQQTHLFAHVSYGRCDLKLCLYVTAMVWSSFVNMKCHLWQRFRSGSSVTDLTNTRTHAHTHPLTLLTKELQNEKVSWEVTCKEQDFTRPKSAIWSYASPVDKCYCGLKEMQKSM